MINKKIFALYLPQYHRIPENDYWWGEGYTEWNAVKNAKPFFSNHHQPNIPLNNNYYDLSDETGSVWKWQSEIARKYGVDGFCIYHYWFKDNKMLLEKPASILFKHSDIDIEYFFCWANEPWKRTWYGTNGTILMEQEYGDENDWKNHYCYLSRFFKDNRYYKINGKPVFAIYKTSSIPEIQKMISLWDSLAKEDGFDGIYILGAKTAFEQENRKNIVDGEYLFEPAYTMHYQYNLIDNCKRLVSRMVRKAHNRICKKKVIENIENINTLYKRIKLPEIIEKQDIYYGICASWDNTPRKQEKGTFFKNSSPVLFEKKLHQMLIDSNGGDFVMINAWNEWGEGAFLEPDENNKYSFLEAIEKAKNVSQK